MEKYGYVYHTYCKDSGRHYVGQHIGTRFDPFYFGSGKLLRRALVKHGEDAFTVTPIKWVDTKEELDIQEIWFIASYREQYGRERMYNICDGGEGFNGRHTEEAKKQIGLASCGNLYALGYRHTEEAKKKISIANKGRKSPMRGRKHSQETKDRISASTIGLNTWSKGRKISHEVLAARNRR